MARRSPPMNRVLETLFLEHDPPLVLLAAVMCTVGAVSTMNILARVAGRPRAHLWLLLLSLCAGATVWSTHFISMLAYQARIPTTYDVGLTVLSLVAGIVVMGLGFAVSLRVGGSAWMRALGGAIVGVGVVMLHYIGMAAVRMPVTLGYQPA